MNIQHMNNEEIPLLPPNFNNAQKIPTDELVDILLFGAPKSWQREMDRQGFDPLTHATQEVIDFTEHIEVNKEPKFCSSVEVGPGLCWQVTWELLLMSTGGLLVHPSVLVCVFLFFNRVGLNRVRKEIQVVLVLSDPQRTSSGRR